MEGKRGILDCKLMKGSRYKAQKRRFQVSGKRKIEAET
jgi:hypothetical protein